MAGFYEVSLDRDWMTVMFDSDGNEIWRDDIAATPSDAARAVAVYDSENVYFAGHIDGDYVLYKYNVTGDILWNVEVPMLTQSADADDYNNVYIAGSWYNGSNSLGFIGKYNSSGVQLWNTTYFDADGSTTFYDIVVDDFDGEGCKERGNRHWQSGYNNNGTNVKGFTILGSGYRQNTTVFEQLKTIAVFHSSTKMTYDWVWQIGFAQNNQIFYGTTLVNTGLSIRCVKD